MSLRRPSWRQFKVFAAAELQFSQPAVSMQLRQIEQALGMALIEPAGHRPQVSSKPSALQPLRLV